MKALLLTISFGLYLVSGLWAQDTNKIDSTGSVGIGTTSPLSKLDIRDTWAYQGVSTNLGTQFRIRDISSSNMQLEIGVETFSKYAVIQSAEPGIGHRHLAIQPGGGFVGLGTTTPEAKLHVENPGGSTSEWIRLSQGLTEYRISHDFGRLKISEGGDDRLVIRSGGNVGIGTQTPATSLHVAGNSGMRWDYTNNQNNAKFLIGPGSSIANPTLKFYRWTGSGATYYPAHIEMTQTNGLGQLDFLIGNPSDVGGEQAMPTVMSLSQSGRVGIGTNDPSVRLDVRGTIRSSNEYQTVAGNPGFLFDETDVPDRNWHLQVNGGSFRIYEVNDARSTWNQHMAIASGSGNVGIGTASPSTSYKLTVNGGILAEKVKVVTSAEAVPDYVFRDDYELRSLEEVADYVKTNSHLPDVPSAEEIAADGHDLAQMNLLLLKKIEELTLYQIELLQRLKDVESELQQQKLLKD